MTSVIMVLYTNHYLGPIGCWAPVIEWAAGGGC